MIYKLSICFKGGPVIRTSFLDAIRQASSVARIGLVVLRVVLTGFQTGLGFGS